MKKICDRRKFIWGTACLLLAAACGGAMALRGVSVKLAVSMVLMLALGWADLVCSTDRQMRRAAQPDERLAGLPAAGQRLHAGGGGADGGLWPLEVGAGGRGLPDPVPGGAGGIFDPAGHQPLL